MPLYFAQGTAVQAVNLFIHFDPRLWEDPHAFRPQRFIDEHGRYRAPKEGFIAFGSGENCVDFSFEILIVTGNR